MATPTAATVFAALKARRILVGTLAVLLLVYALAGFFVVPRVARTQIEAFVGETMQRKISIGEIQFNPFTLAATITDLKLTEADGAPLVGFKRLYVNVELASLWRRGVVFKEIDLAAPDIEAIVAPDGSLNLARLAPPAAPAPAAKKAEDKPLRVEIGRFAVADGRFGFQDRSLAQPFNVVFTPIRFSIDNFSTDVGHANTYSFGTASRLGAKIEWNGAFTVQPLGSSGTFGLSDIRLAALDEYLKDKLPTEIVSGSAQVRGSYEFSLQPLSLDVRLPFINVRDLVVAERGVAAAAPVTVPHLDVQGLVFSLSRRDVGMRLLDVRGARIEVVREKDGSLNLARLAGAPKPAAASPAKAPAPWTVHADVISVREAAVATEDRTTSPAARLQLQPIGITVAGWSTAPGTRMKLDTVIGIEGKGQLDVRGDVDLEPLSAALAIDLQKFPLPALQPYLAQATGLTLHSGSLGIKSKVTLAAGRAGATPAARVSADMRIDDLRATDAQVKEDLVKWRALTISGIRFQQRPDRLHIERIVAQEPYARLIIAKDGTINVASAMAPPGKEVAAQPPPKQPAATASAPLAITIGRVEMVDGSTNMTDYTVDPSFAIGILGLGGEVVGLSSAPESRAKVAIKGRVDEFSPVDIAGEINVLSAAVYTDLALDFKNIELTTFNPYSGKFAGYNISKGKLSTAMHYRVDNRKLDAKHHIVVDNLEFGDATDSKDAAPIPIKLGVALLKDRRGIIEVDLPIGGTLDDPKFSLGAIIGKAIIGLLTAVISAPFKAIGAMFGGGDELAYVDFQPGSAALGEAQMKKLGTLSKALAERPQLRLNVPFTVVPPVDSEAMAKQALAALAPPGDPAKRLAALETAYKAQVKSALEYPKELLGEPKVDARIDWLQAALLEKLKPAPAALETLGRERAGAVRGVLLANKELSPERIFIVSKPATATPTETVRMEMKLE